MNISKNYNDKELRLTIEGRIDTITSEELEKEIKNESNTFKSLILDFSQVEYISSAGLRVLIATQKKLTEDFIPLTIKNANNTIKEIFKMSGFDKVLKIE